jgi:hypothetical protein
MCTKLEQTIQIPGTVANVPCGDCCVVPRPAATTHATAGAVAKECQRMLCSMLRKLQMLRGGPLQ